MCSDASTQVPGAVDGAGIVDPGGAVEDLGVVGASIVDALREAVPVVGAGGAFADHLGDGVRRARVRYVVVIVAGSAAVVVLHEPRVADAKVGRGDPHAAAGFLHHDSKNEAVVDLGVGGDGLDRVVDRADFVARVIGLTKLIARAEYGRLIVIEPMGKINICSSVLGFVRKYISTNETQLLFAGQPAFVEPSPLYCW